MYIDREKQLELFDKYNTPERVRRHCNEVARVARIIAERLNSKGYDINIDELYGAALVHDVLRAEKKHAVDRKSVV